MVNPDQNSPDTDRKEQDDSLSKFQERARRVLFWCVQYWRELFNLSFDKYMIIQVLPGVYTMLLIALALTIIFWCGVAFMQSVWLGLFAVFFMAPIAFLVCASILRGLLEFYMVVFKISEHVDELVGMRDTIDRLSGISDRVDEMVGVTRRIPFWRAISGTRRPSSSAPVRPQDSKNATDKNGD